MKNLAEQVRGESVTYGSCVEDQYGRSIIPEGAGRPCSPCRKAERSYSERGHNREMIPVQKLGSDEVTYVPGGIIDLSRYVQGCRCGECQNLYSELIKKNWAEANSATIGVLSEPATFESLPGFDAEDFEERVKLWQEECRKQEEERSAQLAEKKREKAALELLERATAIQEHSWKWLKRCPWCQQLMSFNNDGTEFCVEPDCGWKTGEPLLHPSTVSKDKSYLTTSEGFLMAVILLMYVPILWAILPGVALTLFFCSLSLYHGYIAVSKTVRKKRLKNGLSSITAGNGTQ